MTTSKLYRFLKKALLQVSFVALASAPTNPKWTTRDTRPDLLLSAFDNIEEKAIQQFVATVLLSISEDFLRSNDLKVLIEAQEESLLQVAMSNIVGELKKWQADVFPTYIGRLFETWQNDSEQALRIWYQGLKQLMTGEKSTRASLAFAWPNMEHHLRNAFLKVEAIIDDIDFHQNGLIRLARSITTLIKEPEVFFHRNPWAILHKELVNRLKPMFDIDRLGIMDIIQNQKYDSIRIPRIAVAEIGVEISDNKTFFKTLFDCSVFENCSEKAKELNKRYHDTFGSNHLHMMALSESHREWLSIPDVFRNDPLRSKGEAVWKEAFKNFQKFYAHCDESELGKMVAIQSDKFNELDYHHLGLTCQKLIRIAGVNGAVEDEFCSRKPVEKHPYCPEHLGYTEERDGKVYKTVKAVIGQEAKVRKIIILISNLNIT